MNLPKPTNDKAEVLLHAIRKGYVDCIVFSWMEGFRTRLSNLRLDNKVKFTPERITKKNRHGRVISFKRHWLKTQAAKDHATGVYMIINKTA